MKSKAVKLNDGEYVECPISEATHLKINIPGPVGKLMIPIMTHGTREGTGKWSWNGSLDKPTLKPSLLTTGHNYRCHCFVNDGQALFLSDCSHEHVGKTMDLLDV